MKKLIKQLLLSPLILLNFVASLYSQLLYFIKPKLKYYWSDSIAENNKNQTQQVDHLTKDGKKLKFKLFTPNRRCRYGVESFSSKEPETLSWIDNHKGGGVFFDIGANVGLYSIYYALSKNNKVYAFEPSVFNLALLAKNINLNHLEKKIKIIANPLSDSTQISDFSLSINEEGGSMSAFGVNYGHDGKPIDKFLSYKTLGFSLDYLFEKKILNEYPSLIKIDVDGIEHLILSGAQKVLEHPNCKTVIIEVAYNFKDQSDQIYSFMKKCGYSTNQKIENYKGYGDITDTSFNQIWTKEL